jgi:hypothetical protein
MMRRSRLFSSPHCWTFWDDGNHPLAQEQILYIFPVCSFARDVGGRIVLTSRNKVLVCIAPDQGAQGARQCVLRCWSPSERTRIALINKRSSGCTHCSGTFLHERDAHIPARICAKSWPLPRYKEASMSSLQSRVCGQSSWRFQLQKSQQLSAVLLAFLLLGSLCAHKSQEPKKKELPPPHFH